MLREWIIRNSRTAAGILTVLTIIGFGMTAALMGKKVSAAACQESIAGEVLRFHVIANSDSSEDQELKLQVKDEMIEYMKVLLEGADTVQETKERIASHMEEITEKAQEAVQKRGYGYEAAAELTNCYFPIKSYGDCTFPAGYYDALRITIGKAEGKNWWCVLFPNLCFVDAVHGVVPEEEKAELKHVLTEDEYDSLFERSKEIKIKWKVFDF